MPLCVLPGLRCGCVVAVVVPLRVYLGYMLSDTNTEIDLLSSGIAYWHLSKSATLLAGISYVPPPSPAIGPWLLRLCWKPQNMNWKQRGLSEVVGKVEQ